MPSTEVTIRDDAGKILPVGETGEVWVRGPQVMQGYWERPGETRLVLTADGWLRTGDIGVFDAEGFLKLVDRKKDMIIVSGFKVFPNEVEDVVTTHPGVLEAAVIGVPDARTGQAVKLFVVRARSDADRNRSGENFSAAAWSATRCRGSSNFPTACRRATSARCCGKNCTNPSPQRGEL